HFFFFSSRRRHTRFSRDWSSDVCSSDLESFWEFWQSEVISDLLQRVEDAGAKADQQPFFGELLVEVWVSEPNDRLGVREENDSRSEERRVGKECSESRESSRERKRETTE